MFDEFDDVEATRRDYMEEAYGDRCPSCGQFRWGGDCGACMDFDGHIEHDAAPTVVPTPTVYADDDIVF